MRGSILPRAARNRQAVTRNCHRTTKDTKQTTKDRKNLLYNMSFVSFVSFEIFVAFVVPLFAVAAYDRRSRARIAFLRDAPQR